MWLSETTQLPLRTSAFEITEGSLASFTVSLLCKVTSPLLVVLRGNDSLAASCQSSGHPAPWAQGRRRQGPSQALGRGAPRDAAPLPFPVGLGARDITERAVALAHAKL